MVAQKHNSAEQMLRYEQGESVQGENDTVRSLLLSVTHFIYSGIMATRIYPFTKAIFKMPQSYNLND